MANISHPKILTSPTSGVNNTVYGVDWNATHAGYAELDVLTLTPNGGSTGAGTDGGDYGSFTPGTTTLGFQEALNNITQTGNVIELQGYLSSGTPTKYDLGTSTLTFPNDRPFGFRAKNWGYAANTSAQNPSSPVVRYGGTGTFISTSGSAVTAYNNYCILENLVFEAYGSSYTGMLNFTNINAIGNNVNIIDYGHGSSVVTGSYGVKWDYNTGTGGNGAEFYGNGHWLVKGFDTNMIVNVDHFMIGNYHSLFGKTASLQIGTSSYYPLAPWFGRYHPVARGNMNNGIYLPCTSSVSTQTYFGQIYFELGGGSWVSHFNIQPPVRAARGFTVETIHYPSSLAITGNYQHLNFLSRDSPSNSEFGCGIAQPSNPGTASFTNTNYFTVEYSWTGTGTITKTDRAGNSISGIINNPLVLEPGESGQFTVAPVIFAAYARSGG